LPENAPIEVLKSTKGNLVTTQAQAMCPIIYYPELPRAMHRMGVSALINQIPSSYNGNLPVRYYGTRIILKLRPTGPYSWVFGASLAGALFKS